MRITPRQTTRTRVGFTLIELLVVVAILGLLAAMLLPSLDRARTLAKLAAAHAELRGVTTALDLYAADHAERIPPTRFSCSTRSAYEMPVELSRCDYLPGGRSADGLVDVTASWDVFLPKQTYRYRAVGEAIMNETTRVDNASTLWVPMDFPTCDSMAGRYHSNPAVSPVQYAVWSVGPDVESPKFDTIPGRMPLPRNYWCTDAGEGGVLVHFADSNGLIYTSP